MLTIFLKGLRRLRKRLPWIPFLLLNVSEIGDINNQLNKVLVGHRDLDRVISRLIQNSTPDNLLIHRLQKRKLAVKEQSLRLEALLVPDIPA